MTNPRAGWRPARQPQLSDLNGAVLCRQIEIQANHNPLARIAPGQQVNGGGDLVRNAAASHLGRARAIGSQVGIQVKSGQDVGVVQGF